LQKQKSKSPDTLPPSPPPKQRAANPQSGPSQTTRLEPKQPRQQPIFPFFPFRLNASRTPKPDEKSTHFEMDIISSYISNKITMLSLLTWLSAEFILEV
jgi:hypothetical protein